MNTTTKELPKKRDINKRLKDSDAVFIPSFFEDWISSKRIIINGEYRWMTLRSIAIICYLFIVISYYWVTYLASDYIYDASRYSYAAPILASTIFWPFIVIHDCELFYNLYKKLRPLAKSPEDIDLWYKENASQNFRIFLDTKHIHTTAVIALMDLLVIAAFLLNLSPQAALFPLARFTILLFPLSVSLVALCLSGKNYNINVILFVTGCGLTYYAYVTQYASASMPYYIKPDCVLGNLAFILVVALVFFIAGATICPMVGLFSSFYNSNLDLKFDYPIDGLSWFLEQINGIRRYFSHLTLVSMIAFFQLLSSVYFLQILTRFSFVTIVLFCLGSLFPLTMYFASSVLFSDFCHKIYSRQVQKVDKEIIIASNRNPIDEGKLQTLLAVKRLFSEEFNIDDGLNKEILLAMISPLIATAIGIIFPFAK